MRRVRTSRLGVTLAAGGSFRPPDPWTDVQWRFRITKTPVRLPAIRGSAIGHSRAAVRSALPNPCYPSCLPLPICPPHDPSVTASLGLYASLLGASLSDRSITSRAVALGWSRNPRSGQPGPHRHLPALTVRHRSLGRVLSSAFGNERLKASRATSLTFRASRRSGPGGGHHQL
jgi:hypothetical protein